MTGSQECVVCNTVYVDQADANGFERLVPLASTSAAAATSSAPITAPSAPNVQPPMTSSAKGKAIERSQAFHAPVPARMPSTSEVRGCCHPENLTALIYASRLLSRRRQASLKAMIRRSSRTSLRQPNLCSCRSEPCRKGSRPCQVPTAWM